MPIIFESDILPVVGICIVLTKCVEKAKSVLDLHSPATLLATPVQLLNINVKFIKHGGN